MSQRSDGMGSSAQAITGLLGQGTLEAAGHARPIEFTAHGDDASAPAVTLRAEAVVDRTGFAITWSPPGMASAMARAAAVVARFVRP